MKPEEKFNKDVWHVLERIKKGSLYAKEGQPTSYSVNPNLAAIGYPSATDEIAILGKLEEWGAIKIKNQGGTWEYE